MDYKDYRINVFGEIIAIYCENDMKIATGLCEQTVEIFNATAS
jgi:hypothetical protein